MSEAVSRLVMAHAQTSTSPDKPVFVGTVWMLDELEVALLEGARIVVELKAARAAQDLPAMHDAAGRLKKTIGQTHVMALSLIGITTKHTELENGN